MIWGKRGWFCMLSGSSYPCISHTLRWRHNGRDSVWNRQPHDCLLNRLFRRRSKKTSKLRVTGLCVGNSPGTGEFPSLCVGNSPGTGEFPTQMASNAENVSIWWRHHAAFALLVPHWLHYHWHLVWHIRHAYARNSAACRQSKNQKYDFNHIYQHFFNSE